MSLIDRQAQVIDDTWIYPAQAGDFEPQAHAILPLDTLAALSPEPLMVRPLGMYAPAGTTADLIAPHLHRLDLVLLEFPKFRDGRGFTVARTLRDTHGFEGDIRAIGHVLPDQFAALVQCGFSTIVLPADHPAEQWTQLSPLAARSGASGPLLQRLLSKRAGVPGKPASR